MSKLTPIEEALAAFATGQIVIVVDNEDRENEATSSCWLKKQRQKK